MKHKVYSILFCLLILISNSNADNLIYSEVFIPFDNSVDHSFLHQIGIEIDHAHQLSGGISCVLNNEELDILKDNNVNFVSVKDDLTADFQTRNAEALADPVVQSMIQTRTAQTGFGFGSHAGYYTPAEVNNILDSLSLNFPNIVSPVDTIGFTYENNPILSVKVSDNPQLDESINEPVVYFDGMHHAREPLSMMINMYYLFWLVENYGSDTVATFLVDNREIYFVPIVNVDGYLFNITSNPNGGGMWRKTRKPNPDSYCIGTDPNRNYGGDWGLTGSSINPCSSTFRGDTIYSESETRAVRDLVLAIDPVTAFSMHSYSEIYLEASLGPSYRDHVYGDYSLDMCHDVGFGYGLDDDLLYQTSGTTIEFLGSEGAIAYSPEIGSTFWEPVSQIFDYLDKHLPNFIYISKVAGEYPDIKTVAVEQGELFPGNNYNLEINLYNKGLRKNATNIIVEVVDHSNNITITNPVTSLSDLSPLSYGYTDTTAISFSVNNFTPFGGIIEIELAVSANGFEYEREVQKFVVGQQVNYLLSDAENGMDNYSTSGTGALWDTSFVMKRSGEFCFTDSRLLSAENNIENYLTLDTTINLFGVQHPVLEFWIAWGLSNFNYFTGGAPDDDYATIEINENNSGWTSLSTDKTFLIEGEYRYIENHKWTKQIIDLSSYSGSDIQFRFKLNTSITDKPDGLFVDDISITDYRSLPCFNIDFPTFTGSELNCYNDNNGTISLNTPGNFGPYYLNWYNTDAGDTSYLDNLSAGDYYVAINAGNYGCIQFDTVSVIAPTPLLDYTYIVSDAGSPLGNDGSIDLTIFGDPESIYWSTGDNTEDISNLAAGFYTINLVDCNYCTYSDTIEVGAYDCAGLQLNLSVNNFQTIEGNDGSASINISNGIAPFEIIWSNGDSTSLINDLDTGNYHVTVTGADSCAITEYFNIGPFVCEEIYSNCIDVNLSQELNLDYYLYNLGLPICSPVDLSSVYDSKDVMNDINNANIYVGEAVFSVDTIMLVGNASIDENQINESQTNGDTGIKLGMISGSAGDSLKTIYSFSNAVSDFNATIYDIDQQDVLNIRAFYMGQTVPFIIDSLGNNISLNIDNSFENNLNTSVNASNYQDGFLMIRFDNAIDQIVFTFGQELNGNGGSYTFVPENGCTNCDDHSFNAMETTPGIDINIDGVIAQICIDSLFSGFESLTFGLCDACNEPCLIDSLTITSNYLTGCMFPGCNSDVPLYINFDSNDILDSDGDSVCDLYDECEGDDLLDNDQNNFPDECDICEDHKIVSGNYQNNINIHLTANNTITATVEIVNNSNIEFEASEAVIMESGFMTDFTSDYHAFIGNCND